MPGGDSISLGCRSPFATEVLLSFLEARAIAGVEEVREGDYRRSIRTDSGLGVVTLTPHAEEVRLEINPVPADRDREALVQTARDALDLDADPHTIDAKLGEDSALAPLIARRPGIRVPGTFDRFELVLRGIFGQQVSVAGARTALGRFASRFGSALDRPVGSITHAFPTPEQVAEIDPETLGMPRARARTVLRVAELVATAELDLGADADEAAAIRTLADVPGIGPWTLAYIAMRALHDRDAFLETDLGVRRGFESLGLPSTTRSIIEHAERWRPWRAYAVIHLWHAHP